MKRKIAMLAMVGTAAIAFSGAASAQVHLGVNIGAPVYVAPAPVYAPPPPRRVYIAAPPPVVIGWYGDRYYDGHRYWARNDWYRYHGYPHDHYRRDWR